ncbi:hypothetical protein BSKO_12666 [Bryopsis sp. KO-2023]|nr:hypothetical protein BSKO_12666 [Bryopsis sp. KO-2023]
MFGTDLAPRTVRFVSGVSVVFSILVSGVKAEGNNVGGVAALIVVAVIIKILIIIYKIKVCADNSETPRVVCAVGVAAAPQSIVEKAFQRMADQAEFGVCHSHAPGLPAGRYRGTRGLSSSAARFNVQYELMFGGNGSVRGTMTSDEHEVHVQGWYNPKRKQFEWTETNRASMDINDLVKLAEISTAAYSGDERLVEVSLRLVDSDTVALVGEYISSSGSQGDLRLIFKPSDQTSVSVASPPGSVSISLTPLSDENEKSFDLSETKMEPTLEKESF